MRRVFVVGVAVFSSGFLSAAFAGGLPKSAMESSAVATFNWTGCHVGGQVGPAEDMTRVRSKPSFSVDGFSRGLQIGCDYQFAPSWVVGVEGRATWANLEIAHASSVNLHFIRSTFAVPSRLAISDAFIASATARLGYQAWDRWLVFARGGAAWSRERIDDAFLDNIAGLFSPVFPVDPSTTTTRTGWTAGTGLDWAFAPHWSANLQYDYFDLGRKNVRLTDTTHHVALNIIGLKDTVQAVTTGLDYHF